MKDTNLRQLNEVLRVLQNINDNIVRLENKLFDINSKLSQLESKKANEYKHTIIIEKPRKTEIKDIKRGNSYE